MAFALLAYEFGRIYRGPLPTAWWATAVAQGHRTRDLDQLTHVTCTVPLYNFIPYIRQWGPPWRLNHLRRFWLWLIYILRSALTTPWGQKASGWGNFPAPLDLATCPGIRRNPYPGHDLPQRWLTRLQLGGCIKKFRPCRKSGTNLDRRLSTNLQPCRHTLGTSHIPTSHTKRPV